MTQCVLEGLDIIFYYGHKPFRAKTLTFRRARDTHDSRFSFLQITQKVEGLELTVLMSANIKSTIAVILSPSTSL